MAITDGIVGRRSTRTQNGLRFRGLVNPLFQQTLGDMDAHDFAEHQPGINRCPIRAGKLNAL